MNNKKLNLALGLSILALNSELLLVNVFVLLGIYLIYTYTKENSEISINRNLFILFGLSITIMMLSLLNQSVITSSVSIALVILRTIVTYIIFKSLLLDLINLTVTTNDYTLYKTLHFRVILITIIDFIIILLSIIQVLAVISNIEIFFIIANTLSKNSLVYAITYFPVILKFFISKPFRDVYTEIKDHEVIN